jgi:poly-gamma-glutamate synthesis protein (capsule biosynthesis protein)
MINGQKIKIKHIFWIFCAVTIGVFVASVAMKSWGYERILQTTNTGNNNVSVQTNPNQPNNAPTSFYFIKDPNKQPEVQAESYLVGDLDTGEILLQKNKDQKFPIASVSKLFTATVSTENQNQDAITKISQEAINTEGENGELYTGQKIKVGNLIYPLLLESSNDAAEAIAEYSGRDTFIGEMNQKVQDLGMTATSFADPSGLSDKNQSTVSDLFKFAQYLKNQKPDLLKLTTNRSYSDQEQTWFNTSQFLDLPGYMGGKRGYTDPAMQTALSVFAMPLGESGNRNIGIIVLRSPDRYKDVSSIYNYLKKNIYYGKETDADLAWVKNKEGTPEASTPDFVTLLFGGDIMLDRGVKNSVMKNFGGDYSALFQNLDIVKKVDIAFANLEGPVSDKGVDKHNLYSFRMDPSVVPALAGAGFNVFSVANNHVGDWGRDAYVDTLARLKENEIQYTGGGNNLQEAEQPTIIEKNGIKIGYLGFSDVGPDWMEATNTDAGVLLASDPNFDSIIQNAAKQVDDLVVSFHWGVEYQTTHNARQEYLAHKAIDDGAKLVIGTHPHVQEDTEVYKNGFIAYSLGNFIFDQYFSSDTMQGMLLQIKLYKNGAMTDQKDTVNLNSAFQPQQVILGPEQKVQFETVKELVQ